jgi:MFS transporter, MHS family, shikimate and dehydroshikimate transport protein
MKGERLFLIDLVVMCLFTAPLFAMLGTRNPVILWRTMVRGVGVLFPILYAPEARLFASQIPAEIRDSGISLSVQIAGVLGGAVVLMIATALLAVGVGCHHYVVAYMVS